MDTRACSKICVSSRPTTRAGSSRRSSSLCERALRPSLQVSRSAPGTYHSATAAAARATPRATFDLSGRRMPEPSLLRPNRLEQKAAEGLVIGGPRVECGEVAVVVGRRLPGDLESPVGTLGPETLQRPVRDDAGVELARPQPRYLLELGSARVAVL